jgi:hypothetical protein
VVIGRGASKEGAIPISHSRVSEVWSRGSSIHKLTRSRVTKGACTKAGLWSCGGEDSHLVHVVQVEFS